MTPTFEMVLVGQRRPSDLIRAANPGGRRRLLLVVEAAEEWRRAMSGECGDALPLA
jgi:hypothetical protein